MGVEITWIAEEHILVTAYAGLIREEDYERSTVHVRRIVEAGQRFGLLLDLTHVMFVDSMDDLRNFRTQEVQSVFLLPLLVMLAVVVPPESPLYTVLYERYDAMGIIDKVTFCPTREDAHETLRGALWGPLR